MLHIITPALRTQYLEPCQPESKVPSSGTTPRSISHWVLATCHPTRRRSRLRTSSETQLSTFNRCTISNKWTCLSINCRKLGAIALDSHPAWILRSEEHTSELQSQSNLVCRLLLEKKKKK